MGLRLMPLLLILCCQTGSNYEKLASAKAALPKPPEVVAKPVGSVVIRPFTFAEVANRTETFRKAFVVPGYKGIDYDIYGRPERADERAGMKTIYSLDEAHALVSAEMSQLDLKATPEAAMLPDDALVLSVNVSASETSMRIHTYGCWPFAGTVMYIINRDIYSVVSFSRLEYKLENAGVIVKKGSLDVLTESKFSFWGSYAGFAILESYEDALGEHMKHISSDLAAVIRS